MRADGAAGNEPSGESAERHIRISFDNLEALIIDFLFALGFDGFSLPAICSAG
jgi:hypothetical protein